ncbi:methyl-accepting chemotaxis protein [Caulobacter hibisci]|uniref:PAS domain-containing protein n=1 Tax=Caulobacter hibisci TaxID=2035993 RepID=A0ABS0SYD2_9CAUL|nr:PAS domain-containing methyl-accepting chemotaxis protein [Caulobacter hibisci]MBI1684256.1 PAS domain-containing protein [Caulobacter hibisci]
MFGIGNRQAAALRAQIAELKAIAAAIHRSQAVIEFQLDGTIIDANENFLATMGYRLDEIQGRHHSMFVEPADAASPRYAQFWDRLRAGEFFADAYRRFGAGGAEVWIQGAYNPLFDAEGKPYKIIKFATDITDVRRRQAASLAERDRAEAEQNLVVSTLAGCLERLAKGDLTTRIEADFPGGFDRIKQDFNRSAESLAEAMRAIAGTTGNLRMGAGEIAIAAEDLSRRTEQQAASLEETAAALDQITATVRASADGARQAALAASGARVDAGSSGEVMREAVAAMDQIAQSATQVSQIVGVIDEIAFQTNLLALNAGVEAARAGDAGRGFAVVAQEVRSLAQRSAEAAKEIKVLISTSGQQVARGVKLVTETGQALTGIVDKVTDIDGLIGSISRSAQEQAASLNQVNAAVNQMDQVTQQNAAMVEEATAAAASIESESHHLTQLVCRFEIGAQAPSLQGARALAA